jgi:outer membrane biosynthesis protein TonB
MGRLSASLLALLLGAAAMVALSSCGGGDSSGLLPGDTASEINSNLDKVQELVAAGECTGAEAASAEISGEIEGLGGVNSRLKEALSEGAARRADVVSACEEVPDEEEELDALEAEEGLKAEEETDEKKEKKEKPDKSKEAEKEKKPPVEPPEPPEEKEEETTPPEENGGGGTPAGGVGPAAPVGGE